MLCPKCRLENPPTATVCDCGHSFGGKGEDQNLYYLRSIAESVNSIKRMILFWIILAIAGGVVWGIIIASEANKREEATREFQKQLEQRLPK